VSDGDDLVERLAALFAGFRSVHGTHGEPVQRPEDGKWVIRSTAKSIKAPVTIDLWRAHVAGTRPLGIGPITEEATCRWGSIDYDVYDADLTRIMRRSEELGLPLVPGRSKSGGLHLFLFLTEYAPADHVQAALEAMAARLGIGGSEIFPKQTRVLTERGDNPSWMVMPYFGSTYGGKLFEQVGLRPTGMELTLEEFIRAAERARIPPAELPSHTARSPEGGTQPARRATPRGDELGSGGAPTSSSEPFSDGPPCLQHLAEVGGVGSGGNSMLLMMGVYFQKRDPEGWERSLEDANVKFCSPPRSSEEMQSMIKSLRKKEYNYTCRTEPMASHCHSRLCRGRRYGVGEAGTIPRISGLSAKRTEPVIWFVDVDGDRIEIGTEVLLSYTKFQIWCAEKLLRYYQPMKQNDWGLLVHEAMQNVIPVEIPPDVAAGGVIHELVEDFLTNRARGYRREDLLSGRPWENEELHRYEFRIKDLQKFLTREGIRKEDYPRGRLTVQIEKWGGGHGFYNLDGHGVNYWWVPSSAFSRAPTVPLRVIDGGGGVI
jgi:hypothetical protein